MTVLQFFLQQMFSFKIFLIKLTERFKTKKNKSFLLLQKKKEIIKLNLRFPYYPFQKWTIRLVDDIPCRLRDIKIL